MRLLIALFSPATGTWGGLTRSVALAKAAQSGGHEVAFCAAGYLERALQGRGYQVYPMPPATMLGLPAPISRLLERRSQRLSLPVKPGKSIGSIWVVLLISGLARSKYLRQLVDAEIEAADAFRADRMFTDLDPGAFLVSAITGIPIASAHAHIATGGRGTFAWRLMRRAIAPVCQSHGLPVLSPDQLFFGRSVLKIIPSIPELDGTDPQRPDVRYVGHLIGPIRPAAANDLQVEDGRRYVFVYMGTGSISLNVVQSVLPRLFPSHSGRGCLVGAQTIDVPYRLGGVEFRPYVPAEFLLSQCDWTICHGGQNTIIQSLLNHVPLIIFPGPIFERRHNARKAEEAGAGIMGEANQFTVEWLGAAFERRKECASRAAALGTRLRSCGGPSAAVEAIMNWNGRPADVSSVAG